MRTRSCGGRKGDSRRARMALLALPSVGADREVTARPAPPMDNRRARQTIVRMASARACWGSAAVALCAAALAAQDGPRTAPPHADGRVVDAAGGSLPKARVVLTGLAHPELPPAAAWALGAEARLKIEVTADERGVFHAELPHRGPFALLATSADGALGCRHFPVLAGDFVLTTACAPSVVDGVVRAGGVPVAATVKVALEPR
jgi:hypothetical protein